MSRDKRLALNHEFMSDRVLYSTVLQWRTQEMFSGWGSTNSVEDRDNRDLGVVVP